MFEQTGMSSAAFFAQMPFDRETSIVFTKHYIFRVFQATLTKHVVIEIDKKKKGISDSEGLWGNQRNFFLTRSALFYEVLKVF